MKKLSKKAIEKVVSGLFEKLAYGIQFNIMDLGKVMRPAEEALANGMSVIEAETLMIGAIALYRKN